MKVNFEQERAWWNAKAATEETDMADEAINRALRWREIKRHLEGVSTILDIGGATGAFSIPLARRGFSVTHLDFSPSMLDLASQKASDLPNLTFVEGNATDLSMFSDSAFDLVLNMDGAISFCGSQAGQAIRESCRVAGGKLIVTVSHRARLAGVWAESCLMVAGELLPAAYAMLEDGFWHQEQFPENEQLTKGLTQDYLGTIQAFLPDELKDHLARCGMMVLRCGGIGSLASFMHPDALARVSGDESLFETFLDLCEEFDLHVLPDGPGSRQRAGLIAVAERIRREWG